MYYVSFNDQEIEVETAGKPLEKFLGLRGRSSGKMLFSFNPITDPAMDMLGVSDPLWMYGLKYNPGGQGCLVVSVDKMEPASLWDPRTWELYRPGHKVKYVLESFEELDLEKGDIVQVSSTSSSPGLGK